jgi:hypothetical protein
MTMEVSGQIVACSMVLYVQSRSVLSLQQCDGPTVLCIYTGRSRLLVLTGPLKRPLAYAGYRVPVYQFTADTSARINGIRSSAPGRATNVGSTSETVFTNLAYPAQPLGILAMVKEVCPSPLQISPENRVFCVISLTLS